MDGSCLRIFLNQRRRLNGDIDGMRQYEKSVIKIKGPRLKGSIYMNEVPFDLKRCLVDGGNKIV